MPITRTYYKVHRVFPDQDYFYLENISGSTTSFSINKIGTPASTDLAYSFDKVTWTDIHNGGSITNVANGAKVYLRSSTGFSIDNSNYYKINCGRCNLGGDIVSLIDYLFMGSINEIPQNCFIYIFNNNNDIVNANFSLRGITTINQGAFQYTFQNDYSLISVPDFADVTTLGVGALEGMFLNCTSLRTPLDLTNVTNTTTSSIRSLYQGCSLFNDAIYPNIPVWSDSITYTWLANTAATGVVRKPAGTTIQTGTASGVPTGWTTEDY